MKEKHKHFGIILLSVLLAVAFIVFSGIKPIYANILFEKKEEIWKKNTSTLE